MKPKFLIFISVLLVISANSFAQNGYEMKQGETISVDINGKMLNQSQQTAVESKKEVIQTSVNNEKESVYYDNGRFKIPGYTPSSDPKVDEENYYAAKRNLLEKNPQEYEKWFGKTQNNFRIAVRIEEFQKMPDIKKQQILANPSKYYIEDANINPDCNHN